MKKLISRLMAFVMFTGALAIYPGAAKITHARTYGDTKFQYHSEAVINDTFVIQDGVSNKGGQAVFSVPVEVNNNSVFTYAYKDGQYVRVEISQYATTTVRYEVFDSNDAPVALASRVGNIISGFQYKLGQAAPYTNLTTNDADSRSLGFDIDEMFKDGAANPAKSIVFELRDNGIALKLIGANSNELETVRFRRDAQNRIYFSTNQAIAGARFYDFNMTSSRIKGDPNPSFNETFRIFNGYDFSSPSADEQITVTPRAAGGAELNLVADPSLRAGADQELELSFPIPKVWDSGDKKFVTLEEATINDPTTDKIEMVINFAPPPTINLRCDIPNVLQSSGGAPSFYKYEYSSGSNRGVLTITDGLQPSTFYEGTYILFSTDLPVGASDYDSVISVTTMFNEYMVYTLPEFDVYMKPDDSTYYLRLLKPYSRFSKADESVGGVYKFYQEVKKNEYASEKKIFDPANQSMIEVAVADDNTREYYYWIWFDPTETQSSQITSDLKAYQVILFKQTGVVDTLQTPRDFRVLSVSTMTVRGSSGSSDYIQDFTKVGFSFNVGSLEALKNMEAKKTDGLPMVIDYTLYQSTLPSNDKNNPNTQAPFMQISIPYTCEVTGAEKKVVVDDSDITISQPDIHLYSASFDESTGIVTFEALIPSASVQGSSSPISPVFRYPGVYYSSVRGSYEDPAASTPTTIETSLSNEAAINIPAPAGYKVPAPRDFMLTGNDKDNLVLSFTTNTQALFNYMSYVLNPYKLTLSYDGVGYNPGAEVSVMHNLYFGGDADALKEAAKLPVPAAGTTVEINPGESPELAAIAYSGSDIKFDQLMVGSSAAKVFLEAGNVCVITGIPQSDFKPWSSMSAEAYDVNLVLSGLNDNSSYYAAANTFVIPYKTDWKGGGSSIGVAQTVDDSQRLQGAAGFVPAEAHAVIGSVETDSGILAGLTLASDLTSLATVTTKPSINEPAPDEYDPPAPSVSAALNAAGSVDVSWNRLTLTSAPPIPANLKEGNIEYEILRIKSNPLNDDFRSKKLPLSDIKSLIMSDPSYSHISGADIAAWKTDYPLPGTDTLDEFTGNSAILPDTVDYDLRASREKNTMTDGSVTPGAVYVYYVRSILKNDPAKNDEDNILKYSAWVPASATTSPIKGPQNLKVVMSTAYDPYTEALISFDAPASMAEIRSGVYALSYSLKTDEGGWSNTGTPMSISNLTGGDVELTNPAGYYSFTYLITGLKAGTAYTIRVRQTDSATGDESPWSNEVPYRTEVDPDDPTEGDDKWLDYYQDKLQELLRRPYWPLVNNSGSSFEAVYRGSMFDGVIGEAVDSFITLGDESKRSQTYYVPAKAFARSESAGKGLKIPSETVTMSVPVGAIDGSTQAVTDIVGKLSSDIKDYYVAFTLTLEATGETVNGNAALTDRITISARTVGFKELESIWDNEIASEFKLRAVDAPRLASAKTRLDNAISRGYTDQEMVKLVETLVAEADASFSDYVRRSFNDTKLHEYQVGSFATPVRLTAVANQQPDQAGQTSISGYQLVQGNWQSVTTIPYGTSKSILPQGPGTFIFSGVTVYIPGISEMQSGSAITGFVIKYGLDDFFGKGTSFNTAIPVTNDALIGSIARMAGASNTQDAAAFLRGKGVTVSARNSYSPSTNEHTIYMLMSLYEIKTNTKVSAIRITNQNIVKDIPGIGANYVPYYKAAYQIGVMDKSYLPKSQMSVKEFLEILGRLAGKINL